MINSLPSREAPAAKAPPPRSQRGRRVSILIRREDAPHHQEHHQPKQRDSANGVERDFHLTFSGGQA